MWRQFLYVLSLVSSTIAIIVPVDNIEQNTTEIIPVNRDQGQKTNVFYISDDTNVDSYLIPPDSHKPAEPQSDVIVTPATYLLPPAQDRQSEYYVPVGTGEQSEWLPIQVQNGPEVPYQRQPKAILPVFLNPDYSGAYQAEKVPVPSTFLEPPSADAVNEFITSDETDLPADDQNQSVLPISLPYTDINTNFPANYQLNPVKPTLTLHLIPPKPQVQKNPTNLYPKKYSGGFKPLPIPVAQFAEDDLLKDIPKAKPVKYLKPLPIVETDELPDLDEKKLYHYKKADHQRKLKGEEGPTQPHQLADGAAQETHDGPSATEQQTSETNFRYPGRNTYPAKIRQGPVQNAPKDSAVAPAPDGRTEFRMHGMKGPHSYEFGYDTGKGKNRQFRYEERDNDGLVHGHYGYMDRNGKLRVVNYSAHPEYGFHAEEPKEKE